MKNEKNESKETNDNIKIESLNIIQVKPSSDIADSVATIIVDKIISDAVRNSVINDTYKTLNSHCFTYLTNFINPYLKNRFIFYEKGFEDLNQLKDEKYFCRKPIEKVNTWTLLPEPKCCDVDRCANTKTKLIRYKKYTELKSDGLKESSFALDAEEDIRHIKNNNNVFDGREDNINYNFNAKSKKENKYSVNNSRKNVLQNISKENIIKADKKKEIKKKNIRQIFKYNEDKIPEKKEKEEILEISIVNDLPVESYENKYSLINSNEENDRLRREREFELIKKEEIKKLEKERQDKRNKQLLLKKMEKEFDSNRLTFDPNGKVINLKHQNYENLEDGFAFSKLRIKTEGAKKKSTFNLMDVVYPIEGLDPSKGNENKNESVAVTRRSSLVKGRQSILKKIESDISKIKVEKNEEDKMWNNKNSKPSKDKKESILPSGGNFEKIIPETGVIITGENQREVKEGGFDYIKKYNKPSFNELSKFISESVNLNSKNYSSLMNSNIDLNKNNKNINSYGNNDHLKGEDSYIGYKEEFNDNNPLIKNALSINNIKYYSPSSNRYNNLSINNSDLNTKRRNLLNSYDRIKTEGNNYKSIQLSNNFDVNNQNLKNVFDDVIVKDTKNKYIKSTEVDNLANLNYLEKAVLPFKNLRYKKQNGVRQLVDIGKDNNIENYSGQIFMNKFNSQIINNKEWGKEDNDAYKMQERLNNEMKGENQSLFRKQRNNNRMKNLGMQIITEGNNKRERKVPLFGGNLK